MDKDDLDDLPETTMDALASGRKYPILVMPTADVIAAQRARVEECERELRELREEHIAVGESSSSEGEAALAAAVRAMRDLGPSAEAPPLPDLEHLVQRLIQHQPYSNRFISDYLQAIHDHPANVQDISDNVLYGIISMLCEDDEWTESECVCTSVWLCVCVSTDACSSALDVRRALHAMLDEHVTEQQCVKLCQWLSLVFEDAGMLLELSDAVAATPGCALSAALLRAAVKALLADDEIQVSARPLTAGELLKVLTPRWKTMELRAQYTALQLASRALAATGASGQGGSSEGADRTALLALLAAPVRSKHDPFHLDYLKVVIGAEKLQLLFQTKK